MKRKWLIAILVLVVGILIKAILMMINARSAHSQWVSNLVSVYADTKNLTTLAFGAFKGFVKTNSQGAVEFQELVRLLVFLGQHPEGKGAVQADNGQNDQPRSGAQSHLSGAGQSDLDDAPHQGQVRP